MDDDSERRTESKADLVPPGRTPPTAVGVGTPPPPPPPRPPARGRADHPEWRGIRRGLPLGMIAPMVDTALDFADAIVAGVSHLAAPQRGSARGRS